MSNLKTGLEYFSLTTDIELDDKITLIEAKHGAVGFTVIIKLWVKIYGDKGYYYDWNERTNLIFSKRANLDFEKVKEVVEDAIEFDLFDKKMFKKYGILTSKKIQDNYLHATKRRNKVEIYKPFLLLNGNNDNIKNENVNIIDENDDILPHSIVEYSIVENSIDSSFNKNSVEYKLTLKLCNWILKNNPTGRLANYTKAKKENTLQKWCESMDYLIRVDKQKPKEIEKIIEWCQADDFWKSNILSVPKLREQYDQLLLRINNEPKKKETDNESPVRVV